MRVILLYGFIKYGIVVGRAQTVNHVKSKDRMQFTWTGIQNTKRLIILFMFSTQEFLLLSSDIKVASKTTAKEHGHTSNKYTSTVLQIFCVLPVYVCACNATKIVSHWYFVLNVLSCLVCCKIWMGSSKYVVNMLKAKMLWNRMLYIKTKTETQEITTKSILSFSFHSIECTVLFLRASPPCGNLNEKQFYLCITLLI